MKWHIISPRGAFAQDTTGSKPLPYQSVLLPYPPFQPVCPGIICSQGNLQRLLADLPESGLEFGPGLGAVRLQHAGSRIILNVQRTVVAGDPTRGSLAGIFPQCTLYHHGFLPPGNTAGCTTMV